MVPGGALAETRNSISQHSFSALYIIFLEFFKGTSNSWEFIYRANKKGAQ